MIQIGDEAKKFKYIFILNYYNYCRMEKKIL